MKRQRSRVLSIESLEGRRLFAAGACDCERIVATADGSVDLRSPDVLALASSGPIVSAGDAGSTRESAARIGSINGTRQLGGSLGWFDRSDVIHFTVDRKADVRIELSGLNRNANLLLADDAGNLIDRSVLGGRNVDTISASLDAGDYFVIVTATSFLTTTYQLLLSAELQQNTPPILPPSRTSPQTKPATPANSVQPLQDVSYFGSSREWNLNAIGAPEAWAAGYTGRGITVAIIDTGIDLDHPDLVQNLFVNLGEIAGNGIDDDGNGFVDDIHGFDFADRDADPNDVNGHGTHVAGTVAAANNGFGATGVAPNAKILPVRVLGDNGSGRASDVAAGIRYAADLGADIINLSLGGGYSRAIEAAIEYAGSLGSFIVAAAGNESSPVPGYPARFSASDDNVISVGAYSSSGALAGFSNDVGRSGAVQVDAPGVGIFSTYVGGRYATLSGTSMASPHIAGLAALTLSSNPNLTSAELRALLASGTVGRAVGSDAIGSASATTTVAFAAAGLTTVPVSSQVRTTNVATGLQSNSIRSTETHDVAFTQTPFVESAEPDSAKPLPETTPSLVTLKRTQVAFNDGTVATTHAQPIDAIFADYGADADDANQAESEGDLLALLS